jgi:hypothetical protein
VRSECTKLHEEEPLEWYFLVRLFNLKIKNQPVKRALTEQLRRAGKNLVTKDQVNRLGLNWRIILKQI